MTTPISFTVRPPTLPNRPSPLGTARPRTGPPSRALFENGHEDDDDDHPGDHRSSRPREERIEGLVNGRAHGGDKPQGPLVIPALPNRDWRQNSSRRTPTYRPETRDIEVDSSNHERTGDGPQRSGLRFTKTEAESDGEASVKREVVEQGEAKTEDMATTSTTAPKAEVKEESLTLEQQALRALLAGDAQRETEEEQAQRELVIAMENGMSEEDAFKRDVAELPEESTLEDYDAVPVSAFGLAMARGMGWNPKAETNTTIHEPKLRPQLLGLGATPIDTTIRPTHGKNGASKSKKDRQADRNAKTGRGFVATSLMVKKEKELGDSPAVSSRGTSPSASDGSRRRRRGDDDYDSGRESKRERNGNGDRRGRDREYETEEERARRKAREREREYETEEERAKRKARERERERPNETEEERARRKAKEREREYETEEQRARRKAKEREREGDRRYDDRDRDRDRRR